MISHSRAAEIVNAKNEEAVTKEVRSCGSWHENGITLMVEQWVKIGSLISFVPTLNDLGCILKLESVAIDCSTGGASTDTVQHGLQYGAGKSYSMRSSSMMQASFVFRR